MLLQILNIGLLEVSSTIDKFLYSRHYKITLRNKNEVYTISDKVVNQVDRSNVAQYTDGLQGL